MNLHPSLPSFEDAVRASPSAIKPAPPTAPPDFKVKPIQERTISGKRNKKFTPTTPSPSSAPSPQQFHKVNAKSSSIFAQLVQGKITSLPDFPSQPPTSADDYSEIGRENQARIDEMSREEIRAEKQRLLKRFGKDALEKLQRLQNAPTAPPAPLPPTTNSNFVTETFPSLTPSEQRKVQWMMEEEENGGQEDEAKPRLDLFGNLVNLEQQEFQNELYHHAGPNVPGYTSEELVHLARSKMPAQRAIAFRALAGFLQTRRSSLSQQSLSSASVVTGSVPLHQGQCLMAIRLGLDIEDATSLPWCIDALYYFVVPVGWTQDQFQVRGLGLGYLDWGVAPRAQGSPLVNSPALEILPTGKQGVAAAAVGEEEEEDELNDVQLSEFSPTLGLLRSHTITRLCYLLGGKTLLEPEQEQHAIDVLLFLLRARSGRVQSDDKDENGEGNALIKLVQQYDNADLLLGLINSSKWLCQRVCRDTAWVDDLEVKLRSRESWLELAKNLFLLRACVLQSELVERVPGWVQCLAEIVEDSYVEAEGENALATDCASVALDVMTYFCQHHQQQAEWFTRLQSVATLAQQFCLDASRLRVSNSAVRFLDSHSRLLGGAESVPGQIDRSFNAVLIFVGGLLATTTTSGGEPTVEFWDGIKSGALALTTMCDKDVDNAKYFAASPLLQDLWGLVASPRSQRAFPSTPSKGMYFLTTNQAMVNVLKLESLVRQHQFEEERVSQADWLEAVTKHIATRSGGHAMQTLECILLLLGRCGGSSNGRNTGEDLREELLPLFDLLLLNHEGGEMGGDSLVTCRALEVNYKLMARVGLAWPCLPLLLCRDLSPDVMLVCLEFALEMMPWMDERVLGCLLAFAGSAAPEALEQVSHAACALFDACLVGDSLALPLLSVLEGADRVLVLAQEISRKLTGQLFANPFLERCVLLLLQSDFPLSIRMSVWNVLIAGRALPARNWWKRPSFGQEDEIYEMLVEIVLTVNNGNHCEDDWIVSHAQQQLDALFADKPEAWITKRLKSKLNE
ncbi:hypothetical protein BASA81_005119 [Batrachochytrium salamandrivorans]|nr:hypothetical protein BASA81_005119 [Batrachochytrium salamandrivorans]